MFKFDENLNFVLNENYTEILRLDELLTDAGIPHTFERAYDGWQVIYFKDGERISDAIEHGGSYGEDQNLLEILGLSENEDGVEGYLTADEVFARYFEHYMKGGKVVES